MNNLQIFKKQIIGFEDYLVTNDGRVYSLKRNKYLRLTVGKDGYVRVTLSKDGKVFTKTVHRLVSEAFIPNSLCLPEINHIDENKQNNNACNLEWCSSKYNSNYGSRNYKNAIANNSRNKSGFRGVHFHKRDGIWCSNISINTRLIHLGNFKSKSDAIKARINAEQKYYSEVM